MVYTIEYGYYDRYGWFKPNPNQNKKEYKTINGARKAARAYLMERTYHWAEEDSTVARIKLNGSLYGECVQSIRNKRKFISYSGGQGSAYREVAENGSLL